MTFGSECKKSLRPTFSCIFLLKNARNSGTEEVRHTTDVFTLIILFLYLSNCIGSFFY